uniref:Uncharacterized protein n=1 Tax=Alexandrium monilatum TaxID=311494 RepID=A0A7S4T230_9DINO
MADAAAGDRLLQQCVRHSAPPPGEPPNEASRASLLFSHDTSSRKDQEEYAKKVISEAENGRDLLQRAEAVIMEDWLANTRALPGNVYRITAFGKHIGHNFGECSSMGWRAIARLCGFVMVMLVQWCAPPAICMSTRYAWGMDIKQRFMWENFDHLDTSDWRHIALTKFLAISLVFIFCLHSMYTVLDEIDGWHQVDAIFRYLQRITPSCHLPGEKYLYLGAVTNSWVIFWCVLDAYVVIGGSLSPKDCVMDSLGLFFLFNLDDVSGDVTFVSEDAWPGKRLGWVYENVVMKNYHAEGASLEEPKHTGCDNAVRALQYLTAVYCGVMAVVLPILIAFTPFRKIVPN